MSHCARGLLCSCSQRSQGSVAPLCPLCSSASCYGNCKSCVTLSGHSGVPPALLLALIQTPSPNFGVQPVKCCTANSPFTLKGKKQSGCLASPAVLEVLCPVLQHRTGLVSMGSVGLGRSGCSPWPHWTFQPWYLVRCWGWTCAALQRFLRACLSAQSCQLLLLLPACLGLGSIYWCFLLHMHQVTLLQQLQLSSLLFIFSTE